MAPAAMLVPPPSLPPAGDAAEPGTPPRVAAACPFKSRGGELSVSAQRALPLAVEPRGARPIYNGVYQHLLKGAAVRLNHTAASGARRLARLLAQGASSHWPKCKSINNHPPPVGSPVCQSLSPPRGVLPHGWPAELPLSSPPASSRL